MARQKGLAILDQAFCQIIPTQPHHPLPTFCHFLCGHNQGGQFTFFAYPGCDPSRMFWWGDNGKFSTQVCGEHLQNTRVMPLGASRGSLGHTMDPKAINHFGKNLEPKEFAGPEVGLADGAYTGNYRLVVPFRKPPNKSMPARKNVNT